MAFNDTTAEMILGMVQQLAPMVGVDVAGAEQKGAAFFGRGKDAALQLAEVLGAAETALADGRLTWEEVKGVITEAKDVPGALAAITAGGGDAVQ